MIVDMISIITTITMTVFRRQVQPRAAELRRGRGGRETGSGTRSSLASEKGEVLLRGVGTLRCSFPPNAAVQWQPDGLTVHTKKWFLGAGFWEHLPFLLSHHDPRPLP